MENARNEFLDFIDGKPQVVAALIRALNKDDRYSENQVVLKLGYSPEDYDNFLANLNFEYDDGYGLQYVYGTIWFAGGTWADRWEYDGSEGWEYHQCPTMPDEVFYKD